MLKSACIVLLCASSVIAAPPDIPDILRRVERRRAEEIASAQAEIKSAQSAIAGARGTDPQASRNSKRALAIAQKRLRDLKDPKRLGVPMIGRIEVGAVGKLPGGSARVEHVIDAKNAIVVISFTRAEFAMQPEYEANRLKTVLDGKQSAPRQPNSAHLGGSSGAYRTIVDAINESRTSLELPFIVRGLDTAKWRSQGTVALPRSFRAIGTVRHSGHELMVLEAFDLESVLRDDAKAKAQKKPAPSAKK